MLMKYNTRRYLIMDILSEPKKREINEQYKFEHLKMKYTTKKSHQNE